MLILVVALLVLLALIGTAWLATTRADAYASAQHGSNTQSQLLLESVERLVEASLVEDLYGSDPRTGQHVYRPATASPPLLSHNPDSPAVDVFLASRAPINLGGAAAWPAISGALIPGSGANFDSPLSSADAGAPWRNWRLFLEPTTLSLETRAGFQTVPALRGVPASGAPLVFPAADADGDGIADAGLWRLPIGPINGLTYYAGVRIIDSGSAFNAAVHWKPNPQEPNPSVSPPPLVGNFFPCNIDLLGALSPTTAGREMDGLTAYRFNDPRHNFDAAPADVGVAGPPVADKSDGAAQTRDDLAWTSPFDQFQHQLADRLGNPGFYDQSRRFRAVAAADQAALAYRFVLRHPTLPPTELERVLGSSLGVTETSPAPAPRTPYAAGDAASWFNENFNYASAAGRWSRRALVVSRSPVSNISPAGDLSDVPPACLTDDPANDPWRMPKGSVWPRASANTAPFGELWRAYWMAMNGPHLTDEPYPPFVASDPGRAPYQMFRSPLRAPNGAALSSRQVALLRSALAAVNTIDLRDSDDDITSASFTLTVGGEEIDIRVFGAEAQPFISEVFVSNDNSKPASPPNAQANPKGFIAVELYNPTARPISLNGWTLGLLRRSAAGSGEMNIQPIPGFDGFGPDVYVPPTNISVGYLVLGNGPAPGATQFGPEDARHRPQSVANATTNWLHYAYVPNLHKAISDPADSITQGGFELVLLRPRRADGQLTTDGADPKPIREYADNGRQLSQMVPVDSFDFTGGDYFLVPPGADQFTVYHSARRSGASQRWGCVFPGRAPPQYAQWKRNSPTSPRDPWISAPPTPPISIGGEDAVASYPDRLGDIPMNDSDHTNANRLIVNPTGKQRFPFGGFARNGDLLNVPFIGSYTMRRRSDISDADPILEMNAVSSDAAAADDANPQTDLVEQVGHFVPLHSADLAATHGSPQQAILTYDPYDWTAKLLEYVTVQNPQDDYLPNADPAHYAVQPAANPMTPAAPRVPLPPAQALDKPDGVRNVAADKANGVAERYAPIEGLINVNTAPLPVLAAVPFTQDAAVNRRLAQMIIRYRDGDAAINAPARGPFRSLVDLNRVVAYTPSGQPDLRRTLQNADGTISKLVPPDPADDADQSGGEGRDESITLGERMDVVNRVSNLLSTRSDGFTCYILLQGWRGAGTPDAKLVVERRSAFIADRSQARPDNPVVLRLPVPTD